MTGPDRDGEPSRAVDALAVLAGARALRWRVKDTFRSYVQRSGGSVQLVQPVEVDDDAFRFPRGPGDDVRFTGGVLFRAHAGFLNVLVAEPSLRPIASGLGLFVSHPSAPESFGDQWCLADVDPGAAGGGTARLHTRLTAEGAAYFGGVYAEGMELDPLEIEL